MDTFYLVAILYVVAFLYVAFNWPRFALAAIFASAPFQNDLSIGGPVRFSLAEVNLALVSFVFFLQSMTRPQTLGLGPVAASIVTYLCLCLLSSISDFRGDTTLVSFIQMTIYLVVAVIVFTRYAPKTSDFRLAFVGVLLVCVFLALFAVATRSNYILGLNKNGLGGSLSFGVIIGVELWFAAKETRVRRLLLFATGIIAMGLIMSLSRGSWLGTIGGLLTAALLRRRFKFLLWAALALVPFVAVCWNLLPTESKDFATGFDSSRVNISARYSSIDFAMSQFQANPIVGQGVGLRKEFDATNIVMTVLAETGILGLIAFAAIHFSVLKMVVTTMRRVSESDPNFSVLILAGALLVAKFGHGLVDHYWSRGDLMMTWAAVGMATRVYYVSLRRPTARRLAQPRVRRFRADHGGDSIGPESLSPST